MDLYRLVKNFRDAIISAVNDGELNITPFSSFPKGCCDLGSEMLAQYLLDNKIKTVMINGENFRDGSHHVWLKTIDGINIDITADQFNGKSGMPKNISPIIIGEEGHIHSLFKNREEETPLCISHPIYLKDSETQYNRRKKDLFTSYNVIKKYLKKFE